MRVYTLTLTLKGPVLFQASGATVLGMDSAAQRYNDIPVINGSLIKGNVRHVLEEFNDLLPKQDPLRKKIDEWFGEQSQNDDGDEGFAPRRGCVQFGMFWTLTNLLGDVGPRTRIAINEHGVVTRGALQTIEDIAPVGAADPVFEGVIKTSFTNDEKEQDFLLWLKRALSFIPALGSLKGVGYGRLLNVELAESTPGGHMLTELTEATRIQVDIAFDRPFCIGRPRTPDSNLIFSPTDIPGGTIKGLIAAAYNNDSDRLNSELCFDDLTVSFFKPIPLSDVGRAMAGSPSVVPLSVATVGDDVFDFSLEDVCTLTLLDKPCFQPDWKPNQQDAIDQALGLSASTPDRHVIVRTGIDRFSETSDEGALFSLECVKPENYVWRGSIDLSSIDANRRSSVVSALKKTLSGGLHNLGKTHADSRDINWSCVSTPTTTFIDDDIAVVVLQTAACLFRAGFESRYHQGGTVEDEYFAYWQQGDNESDFVLTRYFAQQQLAGGAHYYWRYQRHQAYQPTWLTSAGSVFVVRVLTDKGRQRLQQWCSTGLPAAMTSSGLPPTWQDSPYLPENGYGEIRVNEEMLEKIRYTAGCGEVL